MAKIDQYILVNCGTKREYTGFLVAKDAKDGAEAGLYHEQGGIRAYDIMYSIRKTQAEHETAMRQNHNRNAVKVISPNLPHGEAYFMYIPGDYEKISIDEVNEEVKITISSASLGVKTFSLVERMTWDR